MTESKLADDILVALRVGAAESEVKRLGTSYNEAFSRANARLEKCVSLVRDGKDSAALQAAQMSPPLMDVVETLSFPETVQWQSLMVGAGMSVHPGFDARHVEMVGSLYAKKIDGMDPLYKDLTHAIAHEKDDDKALVILQLIRKKNPGDQKAAVQHAKVEKRVQEKRLERLAALIEPDDHEEFDEAMRLFQSEPWEQPPEGPQWERVLAYKADLDKRLGYAHSLSLLDEIKEIQETGDWRRANGSLASVQSLIDAHGLAFDDDYRGILENATSWVASEKASAKKGREDAGRLQRLRGTLRNIQDKDIGRKRKVDDLRADLAEVMTVGRDMQDARQVLDKKDLDSYDRVRGFLRTEIARRQKTRRFAIFAGCAALLAVSIPSFMAIAAAMERSDQLTELEGGVRDLQNVVDLSAFLVAFEKNYADRSGDPEFASAAEKGKRIIDEEKRKRDDFRNRLNLLREKIEGVSQAADMVAMENDRQSLRTDLDRLNVAYSSESTDELTQIDLLWNDTTRKFQTNVGSTLTEQLQAVHSFAEQNASLRLPAEALRGNLSELNRRLVLLETEDAKLKGVTGLGLTDGQRDLLDSERKTYDDRVESLKGFTSSLSELDKGTSVEEVFSGLEKLLQFGLANDPASIAAKAVLLGKGAYSGLPAKVFLPNSPASWDSLTAEMSSDYKPEKLLQNESAVMRRLFDEERLKDVYSQQMFEELPWTEVTHKTDGGWHFRKPNLSGATVWVLGKPVEPLEGKFISDGVGAGYYRWTQKVKQIVGSKSVEREYLSQWQGVDREMKPEDGNKGRVRGDLLLAGKQFPERAKQSPESFYVFDPSDGVLSLFPTTTTINKSGLLFLDLLKAKPLDPLVKAFIHLHFMEMMNIRPEEWGLKNDPSKKLTALSDYAELKHLTSGVDLLADWFNTLSTQEKSPVKERLFAFYETIKVNSYRKEARFLSKFWRILTETNFSFHGFCRLNDRWSKPTSTNSQVWGIQLATGKFGIVSEGEGEALPLCPLMIFDKDIATILEEARGGASMNGSADPDYVRVKARLPEAFSQFKE
jgi:hypothetical protein